MTDSAIDEQDSAELLPTFDDLASVPPGVVRSFAAEGHALLPQLASESEAAAYLPLIEPLAVATAWNKHEITEPGRYEGTFLQAFNLWRLDERVARFVLARRFASAAAALLGVERVRLYHDQALCKGPGAGRTPWHQDHHYWPLDTDRTITMWMPLVDVPAEVGSMTFASGTHLLGRLCDTGIGKEGDRHLAALIEERDLPTHTYGALRAGDATFHTGWTVHSAGRNHSDRLRTVMTVIYYADGARVATDITDAQEVDRKAWLGGRAPGALADHELNPVL